MFFLFVGFYLVSLFVSVISGGFKTSSPRILVSYEDQTCSPPFGDTCIEITKCPFFVDLLDKSPIPRSRDVVKIIRQHQCGFKNNNTPKVCCSRATITAPSITTFQPPKRSISREDLFFDLLSRDLLDHKNYNLLPLGRCGPIANQMLENRITSGKKTALEEFPWMALIAYNMSGAIEFRCGGTIINEYYVLTAAHCVLNSILIGVRLGEYDLNNSKQDCKGTYCSPPVQDIYIVEHIIHPEYNRATYENDIALLRLASRANFTSNVKPICLPISELNDDLTGKFAIVSGWGITEQGHKSPVLLKASVPVLPVRTCANLYKNWYPISKNQICAGGYKGQDSCSGDSGGPLTYTGMVNEQPRYIQYGVVSFGPRECGTDGQPGIYTRVGRYLKWILDNIKPVIND